MGWTGDLLFIDVPGTIDVLKKKGPRKPGIGRASGKFGNWICYDLNLLRNALFEAESIRMWSPGDHCRFGIHLYKSRGIIFWFYILPYYSFLRGLKLHDVMPRLLPQRAPYHMREELRQHFTPPLSDPNFFSFKLGSKTAFIYDRLLRYPDWLGVRETLFWVRDHLDDFRHFLGNEVGRIRDSIDQNTQAEIMPTIDYHGPWLDPQYPDSFLQFRFLEMAEIMRTTDDSKDRERVLCLATDAAVGFTVPKFFPQGERTYR